MLPRCYFGASRIVQKSQSSAAIRTIILRGAKDPATDLWTLPLGSPKSTTSHHVTDMILPAAPEFGPDTGKSAIIVRALYGLKSAGAAFHAHLADCMRHLGYKSCLADHQ